MVNPKKKPKFSRQNKQAYVGFGGWRKPRGYHSKLRRHEKSKGEIPSIGYGAPKNLRYIHPSGFKEVVIHNLVELDKIDPKKEAIKISHTIGNKKRLNLLKKAEELKIKVLNP